MRPVKVIHTLFFVTLATVISGCATTPENTTIAVSPTGAVRVNISVNANARVDVEHNTSGKETVLSVATGPVWKSVFTGDETAEAHFDIVNARFVTSTAYLGFAARVTYMVDGVFRYKGKDYPVKCSGTSASPLGTESDYRDAANQAVNDAARICQQIIENHAPDKVP